MIGANKFRLWLRHPGYNGGKDSPPPPDYTPMASASEKAAQLGYDLGKEQLDFTKQQYAEAKPLFERLVANQEAIGNQTLQQGQELWNRQKAFQPVEDALVADANTRSPYYSDAMRGVNGSADDIYNWRKADIDQQVGQATADVQNGYTNSIGQLVRQGLRYGATPSAITQMAGTLGAGQASALAAAANTTRNAGIQAARGQATQAYQLDQGDRAANWGRRLDAIGAAKGLTGLSQGAYGLASGAFNAAGNQQLQPGMAAQSGMSAGKIGRAHV